MARKLKQYIGPIWSGEHHNKWAYVAATSRKHVVELLSKIGMNYTISAIGSHFSEGSWGNDMEHIEFTEPCIFVKGAAKEQLIKLL